MIWTRSSVIKEIVCVWESWAKILALIAHRIADNIFKHYLRYCEYSCDEHVLFADILGSDHRKSEDSIPPVFCDRLDKV